MLVLRIGPGSLSNCSMGDVIGQDNSDNYNIISIDQRGTGYVQRIFLFLLVSKLKYSLVFFFPTLFSSLQHLSRSSPSLAHEECVYTSEHLLVGEAAYTSDIVQEILDDQKKVVSACWSCEECGFRMKGTRKEDNAEIPLHFLEYSGTRQLAEDLLRFSDLIHSEKLSLYGISYGTNVMGTFATIFPSRVDKFVIDSNMYVTFTEIDYILRQNFILFSYAYLI